MRLLHCIWTLGGGGVERQLSYLTPALARLGWEVHVAFAFGGRYRQALEQAPVTLHDLGATHRADLAVPNRLAKVIRSVQPGVMQTWLTQMDLIGGGLAVFMRRPWIISERSSAPAYPQSMLHALRILIGKRATMVVSNSPGGSEYWRRFRSDGFVTIPNAVPLEAIANSDSLPRRAGAVLYVGRLSSEKNPEAVLSALLQPGMDLYRAVICGSGPLESALRRQIEMHRLGERVLLEGEVEQIWPIMKSSAVMVAPSIFEGSPNAVLEAAACGLPLVVSDIPAHRAILRETSAIFVDPLVAASIADGIRRAAGSGAAERTRSAYEDVASFDTESIAQRYDELYRSLIAGE